jgi:hypothetical protein
LDWDQYAIPSNKMWVKAFKRFTSIETGFNHVNIFASMTMVPSVDKRGNPWTMHARIELEPRKGMTVKEWPHFAVNLINHPDGHMQTLVMTGQERCQNTFPTRNPNITISAVYVYPL